MKKEIIFAGSDGKQEEVKAQEATETKETEAQTQEEAPKQEEAEKQPAEKTSSLTDAEAKLLKENMKKKAQIEELRSQVEELKKVASAYEGLGSLDDLKKIMEAKKLEETKALEAKGEWEKLKKQMGEDHAKAMAEEHAKVEQLTKQYQASLDKIIELTIGSEFANSRFINEELTLTPAKARVIYGDYFDLQDGKVVGFDKPRDAQGRTAYVDQFGNTLSFNEALKKIVMADPDVESLLKSKARSGAGSGSAKTTSVKQANLPKTGQEKIYAGIGALFQ